ncbi:cupin domain-containing protein [Terriglobus sp. RCC_193]|uniref:cupin domain-containing protein n=1 Tax=Terriglobus sp. RCC_193 TaxID=3239218 RepID=UPI0035242CC1
MPTRIVDTSNAEHYLWGVDCDGWHLVKGEGLSVIEERMPPGRSEERHAHAKSRQFFFVLEGELTLEVEHHDFVITPGKGVEVSPGQAHTAINRSQADVRMLVISQPPSHGDRTPA